MLLSTLPLGISLVSPTSSSSSSSSSSVKTKDDVSFQTTTTSPLLSISYNLNHNSTTYHHHQHHYKYNNNRAGICKASQAVELFPTMSSDILVREARIEDSWQVAEAHCETFFHGFSFPYNLLLRLNRLLAMLANFSLPVQQGFNRTCLVAVNNTPLEYFNFTLNRECVTGILSLDTTANFLPIKGPLRQRRSGIAYISNVAVRDKFRRKGIAKRLVAKAEAQARNWGCRSIALHCDLSNLAAINLYKGEGFKCIKIPEGANWPHPRTMLDFNFVI